MTLSSCVTSNFDFTGLDAGPSAARSSALMAGLEAEDDDLVDLTYVPLLHMDYQGFAAETDEAIPMDSSRWSSRRTSRCSRSSTRA